MQSPLSLAAASGQREAMILMSTPAEVDRAFGGMQA